MKPNMLNADPTSMLTLLKQRRLAYCELFTFVFNDGSMDHFTDLDIDVALNNVLYKSGGLKIEGMKLKLSVGLQVDEQDVKISGYPTDTLGGAAFFSAVQEGLLDRGYLIRDRAFFASTTGRAYQDFVDSPPVAVVRLFYGLISTITKGGQTNIQMKVKSLLHLLDLDMPKNFYIPTCLWQLYDAGCTLNRANFVVHAVVAAPTSVSHVYPAGGVFVPVAGDGRVNYGLGRLIFTSGVNNNLEILIGFNDGFSLWLAYPLNAAPNIGDTFDYYPGCYHDPLACASKFNNMQNYRGFDRVPPVQISV